MEIRAFTIKYSKRKAKKSRDEEVSLQTRLIIIQNKLHANYNESDKIEMDILKAELAKVEARKTQGAIVRSRTRWYEYGEKNSKYFYSLEKTNYRRKHVASIKTHEDKKITEPKKILQAEENFFKQIYTSVNSDPQLPEFSDFFEGIEKRLSEEEAGTCESEVTREECYNALKSMAKNKSPGSDGFTVEFYLHFWNMIAKYMIESFHYAFQSGTLSISQRQGVISLIPKKKKDLELLKNWRPVSLLNVDYKILTKVIALRLEKILPKIASSSQSGYVKGRFIGESIRLIKDVMDFTKQKELPGIAVFLDFEKAFDSIEWDFLQKCLQTFNFGPQLRRWVSIFYNNITSCVLNNGYASNHFTLERGVRQGCPLSGMLFIIAIEVLAQKISNSKEIEGIKIRNNKTVKLSQYADDTTVFLANAHSVNNLFVLLSRFEKCAGLKINVSKSEMLWLGSMRHRKDKILNLQMTDEPVYALGTHFSYDDNLSDQRNFFDKLSKLQKTLNFWSQRDISVYGRINIVKTLALSKVIFICSSMETPPRFAEEVNRIIFDFVWNHKPAKIKKSTLIKSKKDGGLEMKDFVIFDKALKLNWVTRICSDHDAPWKYIPTSFLANVGGTFLFQCNYDCKLLCLSEYLPRFYKNIIAHWQKIASSDPQNKSEVLEQVI